MRDCGGNPTADFSDLANYRKNIGYAARMFFDARVKTLAGALNEKNRAKLLAMPFHKQCRVVEWALEEGYLKW